MSILITGFEAFGSRKTNNSFEIAKAFKNRDDVKVLCLPVSFADAHREVINQIEKQSFDIIIMLGETASTNDCLRLERVAINLKDSITTDNDGIAANEEILIEGAPNAYLTKFSIRKITHYLKGAGYPVKESNSAGTFICNSLYFHVLHYIETYKLTTKALFVHVPSTSQIISLDEMKNTVDEIFKISLTHIKTQSK